ncbi:MAG: NAD-dependent epimerase/dehydratase family protein [Myxococcales bacterium]|nr:NAD-dependent epimerase/dehydratase family protein [Myxococcales bacterium]
MVTGGAGFIGSHIADGLLEAGHEVLVFDDLSTGHRENVPRGAELVEADLRDAAAVDAAVARFRPEVVTHQGAQTSVSVSARDPHLDATINVLGTLNVLDACVRHDVGRVVFASTGGAIYGEVPDGQRATVDWTPLPLSPYATTKLAGEGYLRCYEREHGLRSTVLRYANVYGPRQDPHGEAGVVAIFSERLLRGEPLQVNARREVGDPGCVRDYIFVSDVVRANLLACAGSIEAPVLNVCTGRETATQEIAERLIVELVPVGREAVVRPGPRRAGDLERSVLDAGPASPLGDVVSFEAGLAQTARWFASRKGEA